MRREIKDLTDEDGNLQSIRKLIDEESTTLQKLRDQVGVTKARLNALQQLFNLYSSQESKQERFPRRMRARYKQLLLWIAEATSGRTQDEIVRYCGEHDVMEDRKVQFFISNYRSSRYELLRTVGKVVFITPKGQEYLRKEGFLKNSQEGHE